MNAKLTTRVAEVGGDPVHLPYLRYLLSIDPGSAVAEEDPMLRKPRVFEAFRDVLLAAAQRQPVVLVIEDLHWIDPPSAELLSFVAESVPRHKILVLLTHRPEWESPWASDRSTHASRSSRCPSTTPDRLRRAPPASRRCPASSAP
jgi:predicted ATPase